MARQDRAASGGGAKIDNELLSWPGLGEFRELFAYDAALAAPGEVFGAPRDDIAPELQRRAGRLGGGSFGGVYSITARPGEGEALVRSKLNRPSGPLPPLVVKVMWGLNEDAFRHKAEQALREGDGGRALALAHPGIAVSIASFVEVLADGTPSRACIVLERAMGTGVDDGEGPNAFKDAAGAGASEGDFWRVLRAKLKRREIASEHAAKAIALQILSAVRVLHKAGYMHRDLKTENMLVSGTKSFMGESVPVIWITDLGTLKFIPESVKFKEVRDEAGGGGGDGGGSGSASPMPAEKLHSLGPLADQTRTKYVGTKQYVAPELVTHLEYIKQLEARHRDDPSPETERQLRQYVETETGKLLARYGEKVDVWAIGVAIFFVLSGTQLPFADGNPVEVQWASMTGNRNWAGRDKLSSRCKNFILKAMNTDSEDRWTAEELMGHPWLRDALPEFVRVFGPDYLVDVDAVTAAADKAIRRDSGLDEAPPPGSGASAMPSTAVKAAGGGGGGGGGGGSAAGAGAAPAAAKETSPQGRWKIDEPEDAAGARRGAGGAGGGGSGDAGSVGGGGGR
jgi:hypothetical protein